MLTKNYLHTCNFITLANKKLNYRNFNNKRYAVVKATLLKEGVLNGVFYDKDLLLYSAVGWNGRPVTIEHPALDRNPVSANHPTILENFYIGTIFNSRSENDCLIADLYLDIDAIEALGATDLLQDLENKKPIEVSTGLHGDLKAESGDFNGTKFENKIRNILPDHLAILRETEGACSVADGCGIQYNKTRGKNMIENCKEQDGKLLQQMQEILQNGIVAPKVYADALIRINQLEKQVEELKPQTPTLTEEEIAEYKLLKTSHEEALRTLRQEVQALHPALAVNGLTKETLEALIGSNVKKPSYIAPAGNTMQPPQFLKNFKRSTI